MFYYALAKLGCSSAKLGYSSNIPNYGLSYIEKCSGALS